MKKILSLLIVASMLILPLSACKTKTNLKKIRVNEVTHSIFYAPLYLALSLDYFKDEGLEIELTNGGGADKSMTAILSNSADIGLMGPEAAIYLYLEGRENHAVVFGQLTKRDGSFLISRKNEPNFDWKTLENKEIIAGRRGGVPAMTLEYVLKSHKLFNGTNIKLNFDIQFNLTAGAFEGGLADYCTLFEPTASDFQANNKGFVVASVGEESGEIPYTAFMSSKNFLKNNGAYVESFLKAVYRAIKFLETEEVSVVAPYLKSHFPATEIKSIEKSIESYKAIDAWTHNMAMKESSFNRLQDVIESCGELKKRASFNDLVDNTLAEKVYQTVFSA